MKNSAFKLCNETIHPGEHLSLALPLPELFSCAPLYMPIKVIHGKQPGPCLLITAAMHGNELNGTEIINRLIRLGIMNRLHGTLIAIPVVNVYGLVNRSRYLPGNIALDSSFPGSSHGNNGARLAHLFTTEIFSKADYCIDLQTGFINYSNLPQVFVNFDHEKSKELATVFNAPVISNTPNEEGSLRALAAENDVPLLLYEAGEAMRFDEHAIKVGVRGITNVMRKIEMLPDKGSKKDKSLKSFFTDRNMWIRSSSSGICHSKIKLGQHVKRGETLCAISDPFGANDDVAISSPKEGVIVGKNNQPLVHEGEALFQLAVFPEMKKAATHLEDWQEKSEEQFEQQSDSE